MVHCASAASAPIVLTTDATRLLRGTMMQMTLSVIVVMPTSSTENSRRNFCSSNLPPVRLPKFRERGGALFLASGVS